MRHIRLSLTLAASLSACSTTGPIEAPRMVAPVLATPDAVDILTHARPQEARVTHVALDLELDFAGKAVRGTAGVGVLARPGGRGLVVGSDGLPISRGTDAGASVRQQVRRVRR